MAFLHEDEPAIQLQMLGTGSAQIEAARSREDTVSGNRYIRVRNLFDETKFLYKRFGQVWSRVYISLLLAR